MLSMRSHLKKATKLGAQIGARVSVPIALGLSALGCGKDPHSSSSLAQQQDNPIQGLTVGDQIRSRVILAFKQLTPISSVRPTPTPAPTPTVETSVLETLDRVTDVSPARDKIEIEHREFPYSGRSYRERAWALRERLNSYFLSSVEDVRAFCTKLGGTMENTRVKAGEFMACKITGKFKYTYRVNGVAVTRDGQGDRWLAAVPFGWIRKRWTSEPQGTDDIQVTATEEALSFVKEHVYYPQDVAAPTTQSWSLEGSDQGGS